METAFKKGEPVTIIGTWDGKGTIYYRHAMVYSCGAKQMVLKVGDEVLGRHFKPQAATLEEIEDSNTHYGFFGIFKHLSDGAAEEIAFIASRLQLDRTQGHYQNCIDNNLGNRRYIEEMEKARLELHEPRVIKR